MRKVAVLCVCLLLAGPMLMAQSFDAVDLFAGIEAVELNAEEMAAVDGEGPVALTVIAAGAGAASGVGGYLLGCKIGGVEPTVLGAIAAGAVGALNSVAGAAGSVGQAAIGVMGGYVKTVAVSSAFSAGGGAVVAAGDRTSRVLITRRNR